MICDIEQQRSKHCVTVFHGNPSVEALLHVALGVQTFLGLLSQGQILEGPALQMGWK